jgi:hypothetical protein
MFGVVSFVAEFFGDRKLALMFMGIIWCSQLFMSMCIRTNISIKIFPWIFHTYMLLTLQYIFYYPFGFTYIAFNTCALFVLHAILYFWHRYEYSYLLNRRNVIQQPTIPTAVVSGIPIASRNDIPRFGKSKLSKLIHNSGSIHKSRCTNN